MRRSVHTRLGPLLTAGGIYVTGYGWQSGYELPFLAGATEPAVWGGGAAAALFFGWIGAQLPDLIEDSTNDPRHRGLFHSFAVLVIGALLIAGIIKGYVITAPTVEGFFLRVIVLSLLYGYETHLLLDLLDSNRLPVLCK